MKRRLLFTAIATTGLSLVIAGCDKKVSAQTGDLAAATAPPPAQVETEIDVNDFKVDHPDHFPSVTAGAIVATPELNVTGVVSPDVSRQVPVISLGSGKVTEIDARLGDEVKEGQLLFKLRSSDIAGAFSDYRKAIQEQRLAIDNEKLTKIQLDRAKLLFETGAYPKSQLEIADNAEVASLTALESAKVDVETTTEHLHLLGSDPDHPEGTVAIYSPAAGVITDQEITLSAGVQALTPPNPFTISDLSHVWIMCDVYENDMGHVHLNEYADIHLNAYPDRVLKGRISNILPILDPNIRTAKVRLEVDNPEKLMRLGMFVTATFHGLQAERHAVVPATAIVHLHDREWVYSPLPNGHFKRYEVTSGRTLPDGRQEVISGVTPGQMVVTNALILQDTSEK